VVVGEGWSVRGPKRLKEFSDITKPDPRNRLFVRFDTGQRGAAPLTLEYYYECVAAIQLTAAVPGEVLGYMETVKNLFVYGWFFYPLCTVAGYLSIFILEMALRMRMDVQGRKGPGLRGLLQRAIKQGLIDHEWTSHMNELDQWEFAWNIDLPPDSSRPGPLVLQAQAVADQRVEMRNAFAHPEYEPVSSPDDALRTITVTSEIINQLWRNEKKG
jgi:hypothetical protein